MKIKAGGEEFDIRLADVSDVIRTAVSLKIGEDLGTLEPGGPKEIGIDSMMGAAWLLADPRAEILMELIMREFDEEWRNFEKVRNDNGKLGS